MNVYIALERLVQHLATLEMIQAEDSIYARNQVMSLLGLLDFPNSLVMEEGIEQEIPDLLEELVQFAVEEGIIEDLLDEKEILSSKIMNVFMPKPSDVNQAFYEKWKESPGKATEYFYKLSRDSNYIQTKRIGKNINYKSETPYGELDITINLSKPRKTLKRLPGKRKEKRFLPNIRNVCFA